MKKVLLWVLTLVSVTATYAQNSSTIQQAGESQIGLNNQNGSGLTGVITQTASPGSNSANQAYMIQSGQGHMATITQTDGSRYNRAGLAQEGNGTGSTALIEQIGSGGQGTRNSDPTYSFGEANWAGIAQHGQGNNAKIWQNEVSNEIVLMGGPLSGRSFETSVPTQKNFAEIWQYGSGNGASGEREVWINQSGSLNNRAEIFQGEDSRGGTTTGTYSTSYAVSDNGARINQTNGSTENTANIRQFSNENDAAVDQNDPASYQNKADIRQGLGSDQQSSGGNIAYINQTTNSTSNTATVAQYGKDNEATVYQYGNSGNSTSNIASVSQTAGSSENIAKIFQDDEASSGMNSTKNNGRIVQSGATGYALVEQAFGSTQNTALINQGSGATSSTALIGQRQSTGGTATVTQNLTATGSSNYAVIAQGIETGAVVTNMSATIGQEGSSNVATLLQLGTGHQAVINQYGNGNIVKGTGSTTSTREGNFSNMAEQTGTGHSLIVTQVSPGGSNSTIFNTLDVQQSGTGSKLILNQVAETASNIMTLRQSGSSNQAIIQQNGSSLLTP